MIITIDGYSGTGKSSVAKKLADRLGFTYYDTGAMYRAVAYGFIKHKIALTDQARINGFLKHFSLDIRVLKGQIKYFFEGEDISDAIRKLAVASLVSEVASIREVRESLWTIQRKLGQRGDAVFEGRDMGSFVFPSADVKIFLVADKQVRAARRYIELERKFPGECHSLSEIERNIVKRDKIDATRKTSPLKMAPDARVIDTTRLTIEDVVNQILKMVDDNL